MVMIKKTRSFLNLKANYQSEKKTCHDKTLHSSTLPLNDILPRFETWQGKTTRKNKTFSHTGLLRMDCFSNQVILLFG